MKNTKFPLEKSDIHYDPTTEEVSLKRDKFDAFVKYAGGLLEELESAEDAADFADFQARKAEKTSNLLQALLEDVAHGTAAIRRWLDSPNHSIRELSEKTGIPYATCYRIVNERLGTQDVEIGELNKMIAVVLPSTQEMARAVGVGQRQMRVMVGLGKEAVAGSLAATLGATGTQVTTVHAGKELGQSVAQVDPDVVMLDASMPNLQIGLEALRKHAENDRKTVTVIITGEPPASKANLLEGVLEKTRALEQTTGEAAVE